MPSKSKVLAIMLCFIGVTAMSMFQLPMYMSVYSPAPAVLYGGESVYVTGYVYYFNETTLIETPAVGVEVRIFATDELFDEYVFTDEEGFFYSNERYEAGQVLKLTIGEAKFYPFIDYYVDDTVFLGAFGILALS